MSAEKIQKGDYGQVWELTFIDVDTDAAADLSTYTASQSMIFEDPDGNQTTKTAAFASDGSDGIITYTTEDGLIDQAGIWKVRGQVTSASAQLSSEWHAFDVED